MLIGFWVRNTSYIECSMVDLGRGGVIVGKPDSEIEVTLVGDSHGSMYGREFADMCKRNALKGRVLTFNGKDPLPSPNGNQLHESISEVLLGKKPSVSVLIVDWTSKSLDGLSRVKSAITEFDRMSQNLVVVTTIPQLPTSFSRDVVRASGLKPFYEAPDKAKLRASVEWEL